MKKIICLVAVIASIVFFGSCSGDEPLVDVLQPEQQTQNTNGTGVPFAINTTVEGCEATRVKDNALSYFQLYGYDATADTNWWIDNLTFAKDGSSWTSSEVGDWPTTATSDFYGISNNTAFASENAVMTNVKNGSFTYTLPANAANQENLLVAYASGSFNGPVNMKFYHALDAITSVKLKMNTRITGCNDADTKYVMIVKSITFHNLINSSTFTFAKNVNAPGSWASSTLTANQWVASTAKGDVTIDLNQTFECTAPHSSKSKINRDATDGTFIWEVDMPHYIFLLPQSNIIGWDPEGIDATTYVVNNAPENAYVTIRCVFYNYSEDNVNDTPNDPNNGKTYADALIYDGSQTLQYVEDAATNNGANMYISFGDGKSFGFNKSHSLTLNLVETYRETSSGIKQTFESAVFSN